MKFERYLNESKNLKFSGIAKNSSPQLVDIQKVIEGVSLITVELKIKMDFKLIDNSSVQFSVKDKKTLKIVSMMFRLAGMIVIV